MLTDRRTDMTKLRVAFRNFVKKPKNEKKREGYEQSTQHGWEEIRIALKM